MADFTNKYNTVLDTNQEKLFNDWINKQSISTGRNINNDLYDYDLKGWWKNNQNINLNGAHLTDTYKKPNHPTFSNQSQYHGIDNNQGGNWLKQNDGSWSFTPGNTNLQNFKPNQLQDYFKQVEPGNQLILPSK